MWLHTTLGFYSITLAPKYPGKLQMRARVRRDLENFLTAFELDQPLEDSNDAIGIRAEMKNILYTPGRDYRWRILFPDKTDWKERVFAVLFGTIAYGNFKEEIARTNQCDKLHELHEIWALTRNWQGREAAPASVSMRPARSNHHPTEPQPTGSKLRATLSRTQEDLLKKASREWLPLPAGIGCTNMTLNGLEKRGLVETKLGDNLYTWYWRRCEEARKGGQHVNSSPMQGTRTRPVKRGGETTDKARR